MMTSGSALGATTPWSSESHERDRSVVLQIGPVPGTSGGIAAVIEEILKFESVHFEQTPCPSWAPNGKLASFPTAARAAVKMCGTIKRWSIAHVHLSEYGSFVREGLLIVLAKLLRKPAVVTLHGADLNRHIAKYPRLTRRVLSSADLILCLGRNHAALVEAIAQTPTQVIANPIGAESFSSGVSSSPRSTPLTFLYAGEIGTRKGHDRLIAAWPAVRSRFPEARLHIAGPVAGGYSTTTLPGATYLGNLSRAGLREELTKATATVLPSRAEVLPMALIEAHAQGTPAVYTKVGEWQVFQDAPGIRLIDVEAKSENEIVTSLADAMIDCAVDRRDYRSDLTDWTRRIFSAEVVAAQLDEAYDRVLNKKFNRVDQSPTRQKSEATVIPVADEDRLPGEATEDQ